MTSPSSYGLLGPTAAAAAITSLANTTTPLPALGTPTSTTPPASLVSPRLTPKEQSSSEGTTGDPNRGCLNMPPLPPLVNSAVLSDDEDLKKSGLFPSFLPIRQLRLRAQEHLEAATASANLINKENGFDSSSSPAGAAATTQS